MENTNNILATKRDWRMAERRQSNRRQRDGSMEDRKLAANILKINREHQNNIRAIEKNKEHGAFMVAVCMVLALLLIVGVHGCAHAYTLNQWADAIKHAEGNNNYGILSIKCGSEKECRRICKNTVKNNYLRWKQSGESVAFLPYLQRRYCPIGSSNDPTGLNTHWERNVEYWLRRG